MALPPGHGSIDQLIQQFERQDGGDVDFRARLQALVNARDREAEQFQPLTATIGQLTRESQQAAGSIKAELEALRAKNRELAEQLEKVRGNYDSAGRALIDTVVSLVKTRQTLNSVAAGATPAPPQ